jgi:hypothetical protein
MKAQDEFYIGWEGKAPPATGRLLRKTVIGLVCLTATLGLSLAISQRTIGLSAFEWGRIKSFSGTFLSKPYPHLLVKRPGTSNGQNTYSSYYLVKPFKFGLDAETEARFNGQEVNLNGTMIYREGQTMIEVAANSLQPSPSTNALAPAVTESLGRQTLLGEIVDSKCYLGVMNPGQFIPHRACAIRCISGGIPPILLVRQPDGTSLYFMLVSADGHPVNQQVLDLVAEPVEITGQVERQGDLLILRADPATYRRNSR